VRNKIGKFGQLSEEGKLLNKFEKRIIREAHTEPDKTRRI
jgi:hypothetical protein